MPAFLCLSITLLQREPSLETMAVQLESNGGQVCLKKICE